MVITLVLWQEVVGSNPTWVQEFTLATENNISK